MVYRTGYDKDGMTLYFIFLLLDGEQIQQDGVSFIPPDLLGDHGSLFPCLRHRIVQVRDLEEKV